MLRQYGFSAEELPFDDEGNLPHDRDPKLAWAAQHPESFPVEINRAPQRVLLRVPGIGPLGAAAIVQARRSDRLRTLQDLQRLGVRSQQAAPFILFDGRAPSHQLRLLAE
jgi:predicted DNA-binding helix-hairpin-helix protein